MKFLIIIDLSSDEFALEDALFILVLGTLGFYL